MSVTQLNATYVPEEDRVLFRFNTSESFEYRLWFTRAVVRDILAIAQQASVAVLAKHHPPEQAKAIAEFKQQAKLENPQFTTFTPSTKYPMGAEPILVHRATIVLQNPGSSLELTLVKGQVMKIQLTEDMIGQIRLLLQTIADKALWGLSTPSALLGADPSVSITGHTSSTQTPGSAGPSDSDPNQASGEGAGHGSGQGPGSGSKLLH